LENQKETAPKFACGAKTVAIDGLQQNKSEEKAFYNSYGR
jgi:hypothetical protein